MVPVNHMQCGDISLPGCFTYRKGSLWISQLDWVICHSRLIPYVIDFNVTQDPCIPSDHAAISITVNVSQVDYENLHAHARDLGQSFFYPPRGSLLNCCSDAMLDVCYFMHIYILTKPAICITVCLHNQKACSAQLHQLLSSLNCT